MTDDTSRKREAAAAFDESASEYLRATSTGLAMTCPARVVV